jgi:hemoglobin
MSETVSGTTIYQRIGGEAAIRAAVDRFYERVLADPSLSHFFSGVSMALLKAHQFAFLSQALGGPKQYGASMRDAHSRLAIEQRHFDSVAVHLVETLPELGVPEDLISEIAAAVTPLSSQIVNTHLGQ